MAGSTLKDLLNKIKKKKKKKVPRKRTNVNVKIKTGNSSSRDATEKITEVNNRDENEVAQNMPNQSDQQKNKIEEDKKNERDQEGTGDNMHLIADNNELSRLPSPIKNMKATNLVVDLIQNMLESFSSQDMVESTEESKTKMGRLWRLHGQ